MTGVGLMLVLFKLCAMLTQYYVEIYYGSLL